MVDTTIPLYVPVVKNSFRKCIPKCGDGENWIADPFIENNLMSATPFIQEKERGQALDSRY